LLEPIGLIEGMGFMGDMALGAGVLLGRVVGLFAGG